MKSNFLKFFTCLFFGMFLLGTAQSYGQTKSPSPDPKSNPAQNHKQAPGENTKPAPTTGEWTKDVDCVDLYVTKGCINYNVAWFGDKGTTNPTMVKVCPNPQSNKPVNICKKGAKGVTVKYEKLDKGAEVEFKPTKNSVKQ